MCTFSHARPHINLLMSFLKVYKDVFKFNVKIHISFLDSKLVVCQNKLPDMCEHFGSSYFMPFRVPNVLPQMSPQNVARSKMTHYGMGGRPL